MLDLNRFLRRRERFQLAVDEEVALLRRRHGEAAYAHALQKLRRSDLTTRYRKILERAAVALRR
jgi:hypothetical protein